MAAHVTDIIVPLTARVNAAERQRKEELQQTIEGYVPFMDKLVELELQHEALLALCDSLRDSPLINVVKRRIRSILDTQAANKD